MTDFRATDSAGADMSIEWTGDGGARIRVGGTQPLDQPGCSIKRSREEMAALRDYLDEELGPPARSRKEYLEDQLNELANAYTGNPFRDGKINARINELTQELAIKPAKGG